MNLQYEFTLNIPKLFSRNMLKLIAVFCMLLDHTAVLFISPECSIYFIFRFLGRITAPVMAFFIAEGYRRTSNINKYSLRLFVFSIISAIPFIWFETGQPWPLTSDVSTFDSISLPLQINGIDVRGCRLSVISTLFLGQAAIRVCKSASIRNISKLVILAVIFYLSSFCDWGYYMISWCLIFYFMDDSPDIMWTLYVFICCLYMLNINFLADPFSPALTGGTTFNPISLGTLLAVPLISMYDRSRGNGSPLLPRRFLYWFYPVHLTVLKLIGEMRV